MQIFFSFISTRFFFHYVYGLSLFFFSKKKKCPYIKSYIKGFVNLISIDARIMLWFLKRHLQRPFIKSEIFRFKRCDFSIYS